MEILYLDTEWGSEKYESISKAVYSLVYNKNGLVIKGLRYKILIFS